MNKLGLKPQNMRHIIKAIESDENEENDDAREPKS